MQKLIVVGILALLTTTAEAGLSKAPQPAETLRNAHAETKSVVKPGQPARKKQKRREEDDDEIRIDIDID